MARTYEQTHPWIDFRFDPRRLSPLTWKLLGEAESKCQHVAGVPLRPEVAKQLHTIYLSKGIHATTSIEGNTLSEQQVLARIEGRLQLPKSREYLGREVDNILEACNGIVHDVVSRRPLQLTPDRVNEFNRTVLEDLEVEEGVIPGVVRSHSVGVARYLGAPPEDCEYLLARLCEWLGGPDFDPQSSEEAFTAALLKAVLAHLYIAWIHPYGDGNGRTARLIEFQLLVQAGVPLPAAHLLSDHYNTTRSRYYHELDKTSKPPFPVHRFVHYALEGFVDELRQQLHVIREHQMDVTWENYVHEIFRDQETKARMRQKHLALDLPKAEVVPAAQVPLLSPRLAAEYAGKGSKTVTRDINALQTMNLIRRAPDGIIANRELIMAFLPLKAEE
ncbi:MAG: Fic family protein [Egibacteraceae bacterium]